MGRDFLLGQERPLNFLDASLPAGVFHLDPLSHIHPRLALGRLKTSCLVGKKEWQREASCDIPAGLGAVLPDWSLGGAPDMFL